MLRLGSWFQRRLLGLLLLLASLVASSPAESGELIEQVRVAWERRESGYKSFVADWTENVTTFAGMEGRDNAGAPLPKSDVVHPVRSHFAGEGKKARLNRSGLDYSIDFNDYIQKNFTRSFDGIERKEVFQSKSFGGRPGGFLNDKGQFDKGDWRIQPFVMAFRPLTLAMGAPDLTVWTETGRREQVNGVDCDLIESSRGATVKEQMALARDGDFRVLRRVLSKRGQVMDELVIDYVKSSGDEFVCSGWTRVERAEDGRPIRTYIADDLKLLLNQPVDSSEFAYHFPAGTVVTHERTKAIAIVRKDGSYRTILPGEMSSGKTYDELMDSDPQPGAGAFVPATEMTWAQVLLILISGAGIVAISWWRWNRYRAAA